MLITFQIIQIVGLFNLIIVLCLLYLWVSSSSHIRYFHKVLGFSLDAMVSVWDPWRQPLLRGVTLLYFIRMFLSSDLQSGQSHFFFQYVAKLIKPAHIYPPLVFSALVSFKFLIARFTGYRIAKLPFQPWKNYQAE